MGYKESVFFSSYRKMCNRQSLLIAFHIQKLAQPSEMSVMDRLNVLLYYDVIGYSIQLLCSDAVMKQLYLLRNY